jgi:cytochrome c oxidase assembly protein subunit 15
MNLFRFFAYLSTGMTYLLIFIGGLVRVSGAGMGCPDWPKCFGRWIPPTNVGQLPDYIDPSKFNIVLAWIEYSNRLFGALVGVTITLTMVFMFKDYRNEIRIRNAVILAFLLTLVEGWLGAVLVKTVLNPVTITLHLLFALIIVMLLIYASQEAYHLENPHSEKKSEYPPYLGKVFAILAGVLLIEVILGTEIRGGLEMIRKENPVIESTFLLKMLGPFKYLHTILGILITFISGYLWFHLVKKPRFPSSLMIQTSSTILLLILVQIISGEILVFLKVIPLIQLFHLWIASWILGLVSIQYSLWKKSQVANE